MTVKAPDGNGELPIFASVMQSYWNVFTKPKRLFVLSALPFGVCIMLSWAFRALPLLDDSRGAVYFPLYFLSYLIPMSYLGLAWTRCRLWDERPQFLLRRPWIDTYWKVAGQYLLWAVAICGLPALAVMVAASILYGLASSGIVVAFDTVVSFIPLAWLCLSLTCVLAFARLFLALPLIAASQQTSLAAIWRLGASQCFRLGGATVLLAVVHLLTIGLCITALAALLEAILERTVLDIAMHDTYYLRAQIHYFLTFYIGLPFAASIGTALFAELMSIALRHVTAWDGAQADIVERFE